MLLSEYAYDQVERHLANAGGPVKLAGLRDRVHSLTADGDFRWVGVALMNLVRDGKVRYLVDGCDDNHDHDGECTVELIQA